VTNPVRWVVTTTGNRALPQIQREMTTAGFHVDQVLAEIGCLIGSATDDVAAKVRSIAGVADVSPEPPPIDIGPPDSSLS